MPRYYCDYCDTYLTHDSPSVRKQHNAGYKHKANVRAYYQQFEEQQTQSLIDQKVKEHLGQTYQQQVGAAFHQHLAVLQSGQYKPPVLPPPPLPVPGSNPGSTAPPLLPTVRPPVLPRPTGMPPGFGPAPTLRPPIAAVSSGLPPSYTNGLPRPPTLTPPGSQGVRPISASLVNGPVTASSQSGPPGSYQQPQSSSGAYGNFGYTPPASGPPGSYPQQRPSIPPSSGSPSSYPQQRPSAGPPSNMNTGFSLQQPPRVPPPSGVTAPSAPTGQGGYGYGQNPSGPLRPMQTSPNSFGPPPPGAATAYRSS